MFSPLPPSAQGEVKEMVDIYVGKGFTRAEAERALAIMTKKPEYTDAFLDHMMVQELEQQVPGDDESPARDGCVTFVAFMVFGCVVSLPLPRQPRPPRPCRPPPPTRPPPSLTPFAARPPSHDAQPLLAYIVFYAVGYTDTRAMFGICIAVTVACMFALGATQAAILKQGMLQQGFILAVVGSVAAAASYGIGYGLQEAVGGGSLCE